MIIARTEKGHGVKAVANQPGKHGKPLDDPEAAIAELGGMRDIHVEVPKPDTSATPHEFPTERLDLPSYEPGTKEATRKAFGDALVALGKARGDVVAVDGEVGNSTYTEVFATELPDRFFQAYIAEQQMVAMAVGMQVRGWKPFAATFAAFLSRAYDFVRMAAVSRANLAVAGSHAGVSIGEDGPSQMALEDLAVLPRRARLDRPLPVGPQPDGGAGAADGRSRGDRVHAHHAREDPDPLPARRGVPHRRARASFAGPMTTP